MAQVIDASVALAWCARSQATPLTEAALDAVTATGGFAPAIFWFEVLHGLAGLERRGIIPPDHLDKFAMEMAYFDLSIDSAHEPQAMVNLHQLARRYALNIYDTAYLELALRRRIPLATRDDALAAAAARAGVTLFVA